MKNNIKSYYFYLDFALTFNTHSLILRLTLLLKMIYEEFQPFPYNLTNSELN